MLPEMAKKAEERRCVTGIEGLDRIIGGGLPVGGDCPRGGNLRFGQVRSGHRVPGQRGAFGAERPTHLDGTFAEKLMTSVPPLDFFDKKIIEAGTLKMIEVGEVMKFAKVEASSLTSRLRRRCLPLSVP